MNFELGENFLSCATDILFSSVEGTPKPGNPLKMSEEFMQQIHKLEAEQVKLPLKERAEQLEQAGRVPEEKRAKIVEKELKKRKKKGEKISEEKSALVTELLSAMTANIHQKIQSSIAFSKSQENEVSGFLSNVENSSPLERENFYSGLFPNRRPRFKKGDKVQNYTPGWFFDCLLGMGGFGEVWKITNEMMGSRALKLCQEKQSAQTLKREAENIHHIIQKIPKHPNIVDVFELQVFKEPYFITFEFVDGGTLEDFILSFGGGPLPFENLVKPKFRKICGAIAAAHEIGLVHRDIKPANILLDKSENPKVTDFGLGKILEVATTVQPQLPSFTLSGYGTPGYVCPEQLKREEPHPSDDVFALGILLYQMLVGSMNKEVQFIRTYLAKVEPEIPKEIQEFVFGCVEKPRGERPESASELLKEFNQVCVKLERRAKRKKKKVEKVEGAEGEEGEDEESVDKTETPTEKLAKKVVEEPDKVSAKQKIAPNEVDTKRYLNSGRSKYTQRDFGGAIEEYSKALNLDINNSAAYINRGISKVQLGKRDEAKSDFKNFLELTRDLEDVGTVKARERIFMEFPELKSSLESE